MMPTELFFEKRKNIPLKSPFPLNYSLKKMHKEFQYFYLLFKTETE